MAQRLTWFAFVCTIIILCSYYFTDSKPVINKFSKCAQSWLSANQDNTKPLKSEDTNIPRVFHHIDWQWSPNSEENDHRRQRWDTCRRTYLEKMPSFRSVLWDDVMIKDLLKRKYAWLLPRYCAYDYEVQRTNVARWVSCQRNSQGNNRIQTSGLS